jgi:3-isopropylmalate dehydrogenase
MRALIAILPGDGIGPEVTEAAIRVLERVAARFDHRLDFQRALLGGAAIDAAGSALPDATLELCRRADAVLMGAVGGPKWSDPSLPVRPEQGLLALRKALGLFANLRPVATHPGVLEASPIKAELVRGVDIMVVRELTGGIYFGEKTRTATEATDLCRYSVAEIERVLRVAAGLAMRRRKRLVSVDKANVLETSRLWRATVDRLMPAEFPEVKFEHMLVDSAAMHLIRMPRDFDVMVTENMFGDILTDEASMLAGSLGMLPSASLGATPRGGLYEPIHGSAPDIAGRGIANPYATILSCAMMFRYSFGLEREALAIEQAVGASIDRGARPADIAVPGQPAASTAAAAAAVVEALG